MEDEFYLKFQDKFRGTRETIKERLKIYLPIIEPLKGLYPAGVILDLGCGRGEWLELVKENGWQGVGIDKNSSMIDFCNAAGLNATKEDALIYLRSLASDSVNVVTGFHIAEHLPFELLIELIKEANRVLLPGGFLILETPNPENITVGTASFYLDPTHINPIPAQLLSFLMEYQGFFRTAALRLQESPELVSSKTTQLFNVLAGVSPDYAIVAQKLAPPESLALFDDLLNNDTGLTLETLAQRYDSQTEAVTHQFSSQLGSIRTELNELGSLQSNIQSGLNDGRIYLQGLNVSMEKILAEQSNFKDSLAAELADMKVSIDGMRSDIKSLEPVDEKLEADLDIVRMDLQGLRTDLENLRAEREDLRVKLNQARSDHEAAESRFTQADSDRDSLKAELQHVYHSRSMRMTRPLRAIFGWGRVLRDRIKKKINKGLQWSIIEVTKRPRLKTKILSLLSHFPGTKQRLKNLTPNVKFEISSSDFLSEEPSTLSLRGRQIYNDLLRVTNHGKGG
ncbi:MAG: methyltransferase domain-containing protein [Bellilinea sp.]